MGIINPALEKVLSIYSSEELELSSETPLLTTDAKLASKLYLRGLLDQHRCQRQLSSAGTRDRNSETRAMFDKRTSQLLAR
jgi:hypothetical protein